MLDQLLFRYPWRTYQARVLAQLAVYQQNNKIHIVAPPGAGKTVLGLEIVRRINRQTLVLVPSLTIRAQWMERLVQDFVPDEMDVTGLIGHDLHQPHPLTIVTYQALHQYLKNEQAPPLDWIALLVVDECHHLRREWWKSLHAVQQAVEPVLLSLTATPPYDVSGLEWKRYHDFCGEIDEEISIPELVAAGDLCHHQDYIYPVLPADDVLAASRAFAQHKAILYTTLAEMRPLAQHLLQHPWLRQPEAHYEAIFEAPEYFSALLVVLRYLGSEPPAAALGVLHGELTVAPNLDDDWLALFLQKALRDDPWLTEGRPAELLRPLRRLLTEMGAWEKGKIRLDEPPGMATALRHARARVEAVGEIVTHEWEELGDDLRLVVLTDYIYPELLPTTCYDQTPLTQTGVSSLFEELRRRALPDGDYVRHLGNPVAPGRLAVLTGSLVILPKAVLPHLAEMLAVENPIQYRSLFEGSDYVRLYIGEAIGKLVVNRVTQLFTEGRVNVIIGTTALLGEGWDAPAINSLVLASTVGSFVLSNQMRGRAIRTFTGQPGKTANIWHPVTYNPALNGGGTDVQALHRRFRAFAGPTVDAQPVITNGLRRYNLNWGNATEEEVRHFTQQMKAASTRRDKLAQRWQEALQQGTHLIEAITPPTKPYYAKEDKLSKYYYELTDEQQRRELDSFFVDWKIGFACALMLAVAMEMSGILPLWTVGVSLVVAGLFGGLSYRGLVRLRHERMQLGLAPLAMGLPDGHYFLYPLVAALPLLVLSVWTPFLFLALMSVLVFVALPGRGSRKSGAQFALLSDRRERLAQYSNALIKSLLQANLLYRTQAEQLTIEDNADGQLVAYLKDAAHHDTHLFAEGLSELMRPVDNPRWLLRLVQPPEWTHGEYYVPVPTVLARRRETATLLADALGTALGQRFTPIYTRDPAGRQHLLAAKLQMNNLSEDRVAMREVLWR